jgi:two-component system phosphate regulon sensor histidine kinase PhoR
VNPVWPRTLWVFGVFLPISGIVGLVFGSAWGVGVFGTLLAWLLYGHLKNLADLLRWLRDPVGHPIPAGTGEWEHVFSALYRSSRERAAERLELQHELERFRNAGEAVPDGVVMLDSAWHIEWCNSQSSRHFGLDPAGDPGKPINHLIREPEFVQYLDSGAYGKPLVMRSDRGDGLVLAVQLVEYGEHRRLLLSRDITEFERVARIRQDFVANVSHELKTPLTVIAGFLETIETIEPGPEALKHYLHLMQVQARNMQRLVEDLLTLSGLEDDGNPLREDAISIAPMLISLEQEANSLSAGKHQIRLLADCDTVIKGSAKELHSAFGNLVSNAIRYTPPGGVVTISWQLDGNGDGVFSVQDTGIGIEAAHIPRLTERFYRVDRGRSRETGGTGLGLAIVRHVLGRHQATLQIESEPAKGSCFSVRIPASRLSRQDLAAR